MLCHPNELFPFSPAQSSFGLRNGSSSNGGLSNGDNNGHCVPSSSGVRFDQLATVYSENGTTTTTLESKCEQVNIQINIETVDDEELEEDNVEEDYYDEDEEDEEEEDVSGDSDRDQEEEDESPIVSDGEPIDDALLPPESSSDEEPRYTGSMEVEDDDDERVRNLKRVLKEHMMELQQEKMELQEERRILKARTMRSQMRAGRPHNAE